MKKFLYFAALLAAFSLSLSSCEKEKGGSSKKTAIEFSKALYQVYAKGDVTITLETAKPVSRELTVPITSSGSAVWGEDFEMDEAIIFEAGATSASTVLHNKDLSASKTLTLSFTAPKGYKAGTKYSASVVPADEEAVILTFDCTENVLHEEYVATITAEGSVSGSSWKAAEDIVIPIVRSGAGASFCTYSNPVIKAGTNKALFTVHIYPYDHKSGEAVTFTPNTDENPRLVAGDHSSLTLHLVGKLTAEDFLGTWKFEKILSEGDLNEFYEMCGDDITLLPTHNEGFEFLFYQKGYEIWVKPQGSGDFNWYFRECKIMESWQKNLCSGAIELHAWDGTGSSSLAEESNMFVSGDPDGIPVLVSGYFTLSEVNWAFRDDQEDLKEAVIAFGFLPNGKLVMQLKEFDLTKPKFGHELFITEYGGEWDPEFMSFASLFSRK